MAKDGGYELYQSKGLYVLNIFYFFTFFKRSRPFKKQKTILSGLAQLNNLTVTCGVIESR